MIESGFNPKSILKWFTDNIVMTIFIVLILLGLMLSKGLTVDFVLNDLSDRVFRNLFLVLSLVIPVVAGLGLNFGIVIGAMAAQIAIVIVRFMNVGGSLGIFLCFLFTVPMAVLFGYFTGKLYNKTRGQEMIASLIVGFFADGLYRFLFLFVIGYIIPVPADHPMIIPKGVGIRMTVDLLPAKENGLKYALESLRVPLMWAVLVVAAFLLIMLLFRRFRRNALPGYGAPVTGMMYYTNITLCVIAMAVATLSILTNNVLMTVKPIPVVTAVLILALCAFTEIIMRTKIGQDFRSVGQDQHISKISGISVDKRRIMAVIISTLLAGWGQLIYIQNMGTLNTYGAHKQIGMFSVAALLVGGASTSKAKVSHAIIGTILFNAMFIISPELGKAVFGSALLGEYFRTFMAYGVIGLALGLYVWKANKRKRINV